MIIAENLTKRYGKIPALNSVSFSIATGEAVALWGTNGAGKTTTLRCLLGVQSFEGQLTVNGIDVRRNSKAARGATGYVPQEAVFYDMSVMETLHFYAQLKKAGVPRVTEVLEQVQLTEHRSKRVSMLSGGMKQRLALAVALLSDPSILILDEPTANLDVKAQQDFIQTIHQLNQSGKTVVFSTHRLDEVIALASRVLILTDGCLTEECHPHDLAEKLGQSRWLRIWVPPHHKESTLKILDHHGFSYMPNGHSIYVKINAQGKIAPLRSLELAHIPIDDFDLVEGDVIRAGEHHD